MCESVRVPERNRIYSVLKLGDYRRIESRVHLQRWKPQDNVGPGACSNWLLLSWYVRDKRRGLLPGSRDMENGERGLLGRSCALLPRMWQPEMTAEEGAWTDSCF